MPGDGLPSGTVTFLFTDVEGSTRLWAEHPDEMGVALETHDRIVRSAISEHGGYVFSTQGDAFAAAFDRVADATAAAADAQRALAAEPWPTQVEIRVRMGLHVGSAQERDGDYFVPTLNECARIAGSAHGGQVVISSALAGLLDPDVPVRDLGEHRLRDLDGVWRLFEVRVDGVDRMFPPLRTLPTQSTTLPARPTALVGRGDVVDEVRRRLRSSRVVSLVGPGGAGKTHTAIEAAGRSLHEHPDGVWFVDLAAIRRDEDAASAACEGLATAVLPGRSPDEQLRERVADAAMLVVIDNCEHVLDGAADLVQTLLTASSEARVLVTSREPLSVVGEQVVPLPPLPEDQAVRLFVERALSLDPDVSFDDDELVAIATLARRLDGMPLAIELAAARTRTLSPTQLLAHLDDRFRLLRPARRARTNNERQATLEATIAWSYDLMDTDEQVAYRLLSACAAGFALPTAARLLDADELETADLLDSLVARSMLTTVDHGGGLRSYRMLETIRDHGRARLADHDETEAAALRLERALMPPRGLDIGLAELHSHHLEWNETTGVEGATRIAATRQAIEAGRPDHAAVILATATAPDDAAGPSEVLDLARELRNGPALHPLADHAARLAEMTSLFFTGDIPGMLAIGGAELERLPPEDPRRPAFAAWTIPVLKASELGPFLPDDAVDQAIEEALTHATGDTDFSVALLKQDGIRAAMSQCRLADALERSIDAVRWAEPRGPIMDTLLASTVWLCHHLGRPVPSAIQAQIDTQPDRDIGYGALTVATTVHGPGTVDERRRRLSRLALRRPLGRWLGEHSQYLVGFVQLAAEHGDGELAGHLLDAIYPADPATVRIELLLNIRLGRLSESTTEEWNESQMRRSLEKFPQEQLAASQAALASQLEQWADAADTAS